VAAKTGPAHVRKPDRISTIVRKTGPGMRKDRPPRTPGKPGQQTMFKTTSSRIVPAMSTSETLKATGASGTTGSGSNRQTWTAPPAAGTCLLRDHQPRTTAATEWPHSPATRAIGRDIHNPQRGHSWNATTALASRARNVHRISNATEAQGGADK